jgi:GntR family transcriptional regulator
MPVSPELRRRMGHAGENVVVLEQLARLDGVPLYFRTGFNASALSAEEFRQRIEEIHENYPPLPVAHRALTGSEYGWSTYSVEAVAAEERIADHLDVAVGAPLMLRELTTVSSNGVASELSFTYFAPGRVALSDRGVSDAGLTG